VPVIAGVVLACRANLIRADDYLRTGLPALIVSLVCGIPLTIFVAGSVEDTLRHRGFRSGQAFRVLRIVELLVTRLSSHAFVTNKELLRTVLGNGARSASVSPIFLATAPDTPEVNSQESAKVRLLYLGRLEPEKGVAVLLEAMKRLKDEDVRLLVVGGGSQRAVLEGLSAREGLAGVVSFRGPVDHASVARFYREADIVVLPSYTEGVPVVALEAATFSKAIVATSVGGMPEVFRNRVDALLVNPGDPAGLAAAIRQLVRDPAYRQSMGRNARKKAFAIADAYVPHHLSRYMTVMRHRHAKPARERGATKD
jgi:glycosyltransferase involved in cell wall biosynthesis